MRLAVLSNPCSGRNRTKLPAVRKLLRRHATAAHYEAATPSAVREALAAMAAHQPEVLAINAGDGTTALVLHALLEEPVFAALPALALLPGGSTNMNCVDLGPQRRLLPALRQLLTACDALPEEAPLPVTWRHVLRVTPNGDAPLYGMFFGAGTVVSGVEYYQTRIRRRGLLGGLGSGLALARMAIGIKRDDRRYFRPVTLEIAVDDAPATNPPLACVAVAATTLHRLILGLSAFVEPAPAPIRYAALDAPPAHLTRDLTALLLAGKRCAPRPGDGCHRGTGRRLTLAFDGPYMVDGELYPGAGGVSLEARGPLAFVGRL